MKPGTDSYGIWVSYALTMDRYVQGGEKQTHGASRNRLSPAAFSASRRLLWIWTAVHVETTIQIGCPAAQLPSFPVAIGQASA